MLDSAGVILLSAEDQAPPRDRLCGVAFTRDSIVIGQEGLGAYQRSRGSLRAEDLLEGRFSVVLSDARGAIVGTDPLGQEVLYCYRSGTYWAVSNSFWGLCDFVKQAGKPLQVHVPALLQSFIHHSVGDQLVSNNTPFSQIKVLPLGHCLRITPGGRDLLVEKWPARAREVSGRQMYADLLVDYARTWTARIRGLAEHFKGRITADLSGGRDSRVVLGLILASGIPLDQVRFQSNVRMKEDYAVAESIGALHGFAIRNRPAIASAIDAGTAYGLWKLGNLGVYLPVYMPAHRTPPVSIHLHGAGGELLRQFYKSSADDVLNTVRRYFEQPEHYAMFKNEVMESLSGLGVHSHDRSSMNQHYLNFRSRFHFGRNWFRSLSDPMVTPLVSSDLVAAAQMLPEDLRDAGQVLCDLLLLLSPDLAGLPFDQASKAFRSDVLNGSVFSQARPILQRNESELSYFGPTPWEEPVSDEKPGPITGKRMTQLLLEDLDGCREIGTSMNLYPPEYFLRARNELLSGGRLTKDARKAVHVITVGETAKMARP